MSAATLDAAPPCLAGGVVARASGPHRRAKLRPQGRESAVRRADVAPALWRSRVLLSGIGLGRHTLQRLPGNR